MPGLAMTYAYNYAMKVVKKAAFDGDTVDAKVLHVASSGLKAAATWKRVEVL